MRTRPGTVFYREDEGNTALEKLLKKYYKRQKGSQPDAPPVLTRYDNVVVGEISFPIPSYLIHTPPDLIKPTPPSKASIFLISFLHTPLVSEPII